MATAFARRAAIPHSHICFGRARTGRMTVPRVLLHRPVPRSQCSQRPSFEIVQADCLDHFGLHSPTVEHIAIRNNTVSQVLRSGIGHSSRAKDQAVVPTRSTADNASPIFMPRVGLRVNQNWRASSSHPTVTSAARIRKSLLVMTITASCTATPLSANRPCASWSGKSPVVKHGFRLSGSTDRDKAKRRTVRALSTGRELASPAPDSSSTHASNQPRESGTAGRVAIVDTPSASSFARTFAEVTGLYSRRPRACEYNRKFDRLPGRTLRSFGDADTQHHSVPAQSEWFRRA